MISWIKYAVSLSLVACPVSAALRDRWGNEVTASWQHAVELYNSAVFNFANARGDIISLLEEATRIDPSFTQAHLYIAHIYLLSTAFNASNPVVQSSYRRVKQGQVNDYEAIYLCGVEALLDGNIKTATEYWEKAIDKNPHDLLAIRSAHEANILLGDTLALKSSVGRVLARWRDWVPSDSNATTVEKPIGEERLLYAMFSFALEESGDYHRAAQEARRVLADDPTDVTALHALAHTYAMAARSQEGKDMYNEYEGKWETGSFLSHHLSWHRALFLIDAGQTDDVLRIIDSEMLREGDLIGPPTALAMSDVSSLLWRLQLKNVSVGDRWSRLRPFYRPYEELHVTSFNDLHVLLCLVNADPPAAHRVLTSMKRLAEHPPAMPATLADLHQRIHAPTNQVVLKQAGLDIGSGIIAYQEGWYDDAVHYLGRSLPHWPLIGGSHAQRDVLMLTLMDAAMRSDLRLARRLLAERAILRDPHNEEGSWDQLRWVEGELRRRSLTTCTG